MKPCKTLCPGCLPTICPLAPLQSEEDLEHVQVRLLCGRYKRLSVLCVPRAGHCSAAMIIDCEPTSAFGEPAAHD